MSYRCEILADSIGPQGNRLTTFKVTYPRIIHAEMCRHRILSRNTASSRAIPFEKMVKDVIENPFVPLAFQEQHSGMQGVEYLDSTKKYTFKEIQMSLHEMLVKAFRNSESGKWDDSWIPTDEIMNKYVNPILSKEVDGLTCSEWWLKTRDLVVGCAYILASFGVTKQLCNRLLEPFVWTTELISGTEWNSFFSLRCPQYSFGKYTESPRLWKSRKDAIKDFPDWESRNDFFWQSINDSQAEIHIQKIAEMMWDEINSSKPKILQSGQWHIPYGDNLNDLSENLVWDRAINSTGFIIESPLVNAKLKIATARAARISFTTLGDNPKIDYEADIKLHDRLLESKHLSCFEHCAKVMSSDEYVTFVKGQTDYLEIDEPNTGEIVSYNKVWNHDKEAGWCNNFRGFINYRYLIEDK